ncbi:hypothetical protein X777_01895 [Ooceraea biroi]|uniref:THAP-type domain-containing protein n=1 Tax=Ooceraea biroi TaxID=2015173 RepID=A0A026WSS5_OOCBI|nr:hypothetical protein X777_01895 [Ooceraea biroi]
MGVIKGKQKWIAAVGRGKNWTPSSSQKVCEVHFTPSEIEFVAERKQYHSPHKFFAKLWVTNRGSLKEQLSISYDNLHLLGN